MEKRKMLVIVSLIIASVTVNAQKIKKMKLTSLQTWRLL